MSSPRTILKCILLLSVILAVPSAGIASTARAEPGRSVIEGVAFEGAVRAGETHLQLHSVGVLRWYFLEGYVAGLYLGPDARPEDVLADVPKRLELEYFYDLSGSDFGPAAWKVLSRSLDPQTLERVRERADRLAGAYQDVRPGDRYALTYLPGVGTELSLNGEPRITIPGADFAAAYFGIWLGDAPIDDSLRDQLLAPSLAAAR